MFPSWTQDPLFKLRTMLGYQRNNMEDEGYTVNDATGNITNPELRAPKGGVWDVMGRVAGHPAGEGADFHLGGIGKPLADTGERPDWANDPTQRMINGIARKFPGATGMR